MTPSDLEDRLWDVAVVGAGPAGAMVALTLAREGCTVVIVERHPFPRWKVCGACLSGAAQAALSHAGLATLAERLGAPELDALRLTGWGRTASVPLVNSVALSRERLDDALVGAAVQAGATFVPGVAAEVGPLWNGGRSLELGYQAGARNVRARIVVAAAGLGGVRFSSTDYGSSAAIIRAKSRVGVGAVLDAPEEENPGYGPGVIHMVVGGAGYVGLVRQEDGRLNVAAAFDPSWVRRNGSPGKAVDAHLEMAGMRRLTGTVHRGWKGTPPLSRRIPSVAQERLFMVGDAAGYVEPFTGEGMGWALWGALGLAPLVLAGVKRWDPALIGRWKQVHRHQVARRQRMCKAIAWSLRHPPVAHTALRLMGALPQLARPLVVRTSVGPPASAGHPS